MAGWRRSLRHSVPSAAVFCSSSSTPHSVTHSTVSLTLNHSVAARMCWLIDLTCVFLGSSSSFELSGLAKVVALGE